MSSYDRLESGKWALAADELGSKLVDGVEKALSDAASRGFPAPPGETLAGILAMSQGIKGELVGQNGKIYEERRGILFQQQEFQLNILVKIARLAMLLYQSEIFNSLEIEIAQNDALRETSRANVDKLNAETELRQRAIITNRAEAERRVIVYKAQLVLAETQTLAGERILIQAQLATAEKKLQIINSIYQILAAEELVVQADQRRVAALRNVLAAEFTLLGIKEAAVPYYLAKAAAEQVLAGAITAELPITEALIRLGYDRIDLKTTEEYAGHLTREQEEELELLREAYTRAHTAYELTRLQNRRLLLEYTNQVQALILDQRKALQEDEVDFRLSTGLAREAIGVNNEVALVKHERAIVSNQLRNLLFNIEARATDQSLTTKASGDTYTQHLTSNQGSVFEYNTHDLLRKIVVGGF